MSESKGRLTTGIGQSSTSSSRADVAVVIALPEEFEHIKDILPMQRAERCLPSSGTLESIFRVDLKNAQEPITCVVYVVGEMGEVEAALATHLLLEQHRPKLLVSIGLSGSTNDDARLCDVVAAISVERYLADSKSVEGTDDAELRMRLSGKCFDCTMELWKYATSAFRQMPIYYDWTMKGCYDREQLAAEIISAKLPGEAEFLALVERGDLRPAPIILAGPIASGPTVAGSKAFLDLLKSQNRKFAAIDMESGGFIAAQRFLPVTQNVLILRGISDFADERKSDLERITGGRVRRVAMRNAMRLLLKLLDAGLLHAGEAGWPPPSARPVRWQNLRAGLIDTKTIPLFIPPTGNTTPDDVHLDLRQEVVALPSNIEALVEDAYDTEVYAGNAPPPQTVKEHRDLDYLAPRICIPAEASGEREEYRIEFAKSSYRPYLALAASRLLAERNSRFKPLAAFAGLLPADDRRPTSAAVSMGVRVLVQGADRTLLVACRSRMVKMNPNCWSVSANEGLRLRPYEEFLEMNKRAPTLSYFVDRAMRQELGFTPEEAAGSIGYRSSVVSIYCNTFGQWGVGVVVSFDKLGAPEFRSLIEKNKRLHGWEHKLFRFIPGWDFEGFAEMLADLQRREPEMNWHRWYGGALETLCAYFRWYFYQDFQDLPEHEQVERACFKLDQAMKKYGAVIEAIDAPNEAVFKQPAHDTTPTQQQPRS